MKLNKTKQSEIARGAGVSQQALSRALEKGMSLKMLKSVADVLGYDVMLVKREDIRSSMIVLEK